jgi:hypothetical protein
LGQDSLFARAETYVRAMSALRRHVRPASRLLPPVYRGTGAHDAMRDHGFVVRRAPSLYAIRIDVIRRI